MTRDYEPTGAAIGRAAGIVYRRVTTLDALELADLFQSSGIRRPVGDLPRLQKMIDNANLIITARSADRLVGVARALTDFSYCCYLSDLAVAGDMQKCGIGKELVDRVKDHVGDLSMLLLLSSPEAMSYYPGIGLEPVGNGWIIRRLA